MKYSFFFQTTSAVATNYYSRNRPPQQQNETQADAELEDDLDNVSDLNVSLIKLQIKIETFLTFVVQTPRANRDC